MAPRITHQLFLLLIFGLTIFGLAGVRGAPVGHARQAQPPGGAGGTAYLPYLEKPLTMAGQISETAVDLPAPLAGTSGSWCTWGGCTIGPRLYHAPLPDGATLIGWTDTNGSGHVSRVTFQRVTHWSYPGTEIRGLVGHDDGSFAMLLWSESTETISLSRRASDNSEVWTTSLNRGLGQADFWLGDGRLAYGGGLYAAYFTVFGIADWASGHYGDQLTFIDDSGAVQNGGWDWGCSHSMAQLVSYHPDLADFAAVCSSDCFPAKSIHWGTESTEIFPAAGNCGGLVSAQLGQMALSDQAWKLIFNAQQHPESAAKGIALATLTGAGQSSYLWLTDSSGLYERDPVMARLGTALDSDRFLVGWTTIDNGAYWLGVIDAAGQFLHPPEQVAGISWGNRDDSMRTRFDGTVSWVQGDAGGTQITLYQFDGAPFLP